MEKKGSVPKHVKSNAIITPLAMTNTVYKVGSNIISQVQWESDHKGFTLILPNPAAFAYEFQIRVLQSLISETTICLIKDCGESKRRKAARIVANPSCCRLISYIP